MTYHVFLLAAGFGTRLRPLTLCRPKPLLPLMGRPMIDYALHHIIDAGFSNILVNAHHLHEHVQKWVQETSDNTDLDIKIDIQIELPDILGTGGGLRAAVDNLEEKVLVWNGDIIADIDVRQLFENCPLHGAAMAIRFERELGTTTQIMIDDGLVSRIGNLTSLSNATPLRTDGSGYHFTGIHCISKRAIQNVPQDGLQCIVRTSYSDLVPNEHVIAMPHNGFWRDTGTPSEYFAANMDALEGKLSLPIQPKGNFKASSFICDGAHVEGSIDASIIGEHAFVPANTNLHRCIVWDNVQVPEQGTYSNCIFYDEGILEIST